MKPEETTAAPLNAGCITSLLIAIQDFFAQKMNKLKGENHFNKSVMLPECLVGAKRKSRYRCQCTPQGQYMSLLINGLFAQSLRYVQKIILGISNICLWLFFSHALILKENPH